MSDDDRELPKEVWPSLVGRLWHATQIDRALAIVSEGEVRPDAQPRYAAGFCRSLGGISLFDFRGGDDRAKGILHCGWLNWLSGHHDDEEGEDAIGVWFEIDASRVVPHLPEGVIYTRYLKSRAHFEAEGRCIRDPMPHCEACFQGCIPAAAVRGVLLIDGKRLADHKYAVNDGGLLDAITAFRLEVLAKPPLPRTLADMLRDARRRALASAREAKSTNSD